MSPDGPRLVPLLPAHLVGLGAFQAALLLALLDVRFAALPLALFVGICLVAPFFPAWGLFGPVICRAGRSRKQVALTFDDGPDPATTPRLLELLARRKIPATFFVVGQRVRRYPELVRQILAAGHTLGNHTATHDPLVMLRSSRRLAGEVAGGQQALAELGVRTLLFRPPVGIVNPRLRGLLLAQGLTCVGFSRRGRDRGNRAVAGLARRVLAGVQSRDILLLHDVAPAAGISVERWLAEVDGVCDGLEQRRLEVVPLASLLGRPVMELAGVSRPSGPVDSFYDGLAEHYDEEQQQPGFSGLRRLEAELIEERLAGVLPSGAANRVLEIGAGTGRFTGSLAERATQVQAIELSPAMAGQLGRKVTAAGLHNVEVSVGDARTAPLGGPYDLVCSFSAFEYLADLRPLLRRLAGVLAPDGTLLFTTAHCSPLRFFAQVGNSLRQGVWLTARSRGELRRALADAGLEPVELSVHGLHVPLLHGGVLLLGMARKAKQGLHR